MKYTASSVTLKINGKEFPVDRVKVEEQGDAGSASWRGRPFPARKVEPMKPHPAVGQRWRLDGHEGVIVRMLPGGGGNMGIAEFEGEVPNAHVSTMLRFSGWSFVPSPSPLPPPCTCVTLEGDVVLSDGCALHDAKSAARPMVDVAQEMGQSLTEGITDGIKKP